MMGFINVDDTNYMPINGFTTVDLGCERGNNAYSIVQKTEAPLSQHFLTLFEQLWNDNARMQVVTEEVLDNITNAYKENAPDFLYFVTLYNIFNEFLEDISEDVLPNEATGFKNSIIWNKLYNFQKDACLAIINKLEKYNGCILADSVGLGKTFTALCFKHLENLGKVADTLACGNNLTVGKAILDVHIVDIGSEFVPGSQRIDAALQKVGGIINGLERGQCLH
mgnify:CR=1 FL=1